MEPTTAKYEIRADQDLEINMVEEDVPAGSKTARRSNVNGVHNPLLHHSNCLHINDNIDDLYN